MPESIVGMHPDDCFPSSYSEGRVRFLKLCEQFDARLHAYDNPNEGAEGEDLSCDVAWYGPDDAEYVMVLVSATHGVEGFSGSAAQTDWLLTGGRHVCRKMWACCWSTRSTHTGSAGTAV